MLKLNPGEVGLAIDNHAAFVIEGDMWRVVSAGGRVTRKIFVSRHDIAAIWVALFSNASEIVVHRTMVGWRRRCWSPRHSCSRCRSCWSCRTSRRSACPTEPPDLHIK